MQMLERLAGQVTIIDLEGSLTLTDGVERLESKINDLLLSRRTSVVLNLRAVRYIDSEGLGQLVTCYRLLAKAAGGLKLLHVGTRHLKLLSITGLLSVFETFESEDDAVRSFPELLVVPSTLKESSR
jgi:anti-sigma B factor antagonist